MLSDGPIYPDSIHLLIVITDLVALLLSTRYVVLIITSLPVGVESGDQSLLN